MEVTPHPDRLARALGALAPEAASLAREALLSPSFKGTLPADTVRDLERASGLTPQQLRARLAQVAAAWAVAPISCFFVGAVVLGSSGALHLGANLELGGLPLAFTVHAEQSSISTALSAGEQHVTVMSCNYLPCGHCRQFLQELDDAAHLIFEAEGHDPALLGALLPSAFGPHDLDVKTPLFSLETASHRGARQAPTSLEEAARAALARAHAPYSRGPAAVALQLSSGEIVTGSLIESCAYNPTLGPLSAALSNARFHPGGLDAIESALLIERDGARVRHELMVRAGLAAVGSAPLRVLVVLSNNHTDQSVHTRGPNGSA